ncbi:unnamed protein product [Closterium sp. NIES-64]|nr:unnamed protein product [Closterium sp. NIES-64]CAI5988655.1 unnamed protein product [Closterium sp. NIES-65]
MVRRSHGDAYALLGVPHDASLAQVKAAYRRLALKLHPDVNTSGDADAFRRITEAYNYLLHTPPHHHTHSHYAHARSHRNFRHGPFSSSFTSSNPVATPGSRRLPALICGIGLAMGCLLFPAVLIMSKMDNFNRFYHYPSSEDGENSRRGDEEHEDGESSSGGDSSSSRSSGDGGSGSRSGILDGLGFGRGPIGQAVGHALTSNTSRTAGNEEEGSQRQSGNDGSAGSSGSGDSGSRRSSSSWWSSMGGGNRGGPRGPSRVVEPTADEEKRQRIARILLERARKAQEDGAGEEVR